MINKHVSKIKKAQKESLLLKEISRLFLQITLDQPSLRDLTISRVQLSPDKKHCSIYFYTTDGKEKFKELAGILILYKPSLRKALADTIRSRGVPELIFKFDNQFEKQKRIHELLDKLKVEGQL